MNFFNYNGKIYKTGAPIIGADNRGLRYGDGLFETLRMSNNRLLFEDEHFARLWKGLQLMQFDLHKHFTAELLRQEIAILAKKNGHSDAARVRLNIIRGDGGLYDAKNNYPEYIIQTWPLPTGNISLNSNGLVLGIYENAQKSCDAFSNLKHNNYLPYLMAALYAKKEKWNDAIVLNTHGRACDTTIANIFTVKNEVVYTPSLSEGCVAGTMRKTVIRQLLNNNFQLIETALSIEDILNADEIFLTNAIHPMRWVQRIGDKSYRHSMTKQIFEVLVQTIL